jgi:energy-coupling factor transporter ATP-binding protein EcfA2
MMRNYLCWNPDTVRQVINPFAEHIPDSLFRAVHTDWDLRVTPPVGKSYQDIAETAWQDMWPAAFLEDFLRKERPHALAAILGETGSGKSHLVHWMRLNIRENTHRMVLVVRKSGTSLRAIVRDIIERLPANEQQSFLDTFNAAGDGVMSNENRKHELLNHLAQAIREDQVESGVSELEAELIGALPHLLQDPYMRKEHFLRDDRVAAEIVEHIFAESNAKNRPDRRRLFTSDDLQLGGMDFAHATRLAKNAIELIEFDMPLALDILNRNLDRAVARTLSFSGDRVEELMARLRTYLKGQGKELILLVEEFARLQGIDRPLLQAITSQGDERLCRMRTAIAVSTGFFASVAATAYMRTTHIVDMDRSAGRAEGARVTPSTLSEFAARYLNATRLGRERIEAWSENAQARDSVPSKCVECPHIVECHQTFGSVENYGLYPFTSNALWNTARRVDSSLPESLNPRILQNDLLVEVLDNFAPSIRSGEFPPPKLLERLGGVKNLGLPEETALEARSQQSAGRWKAFLEIYDGTGKILNLPEALRTAFGVPEIPSAVALVQVPLAPSNTETTDQSSKNSPHPTASPDDLAIETWIRGRGLDETVANRLRDLLFRAISDFIDWDMLGLARSEFSGRTTGAFRQVSISFERQNTKPHAYLQVNLQISADTLTGQALQGLLRAGRNKFRWNFETGDRALAAFLNRLEEWSANVSLQLQKVACPTSNWRPAIAALELLSIASAIVGRLKSASTIADTINAALVPANSWSDDPPCSTQELRALYNKIYKNREALITAVRSQLSSMKGGQAGSMLSPGLVVPPIRALRRAKWKLAMSPLDNDATVIAKLYREVSSSLEVAAQSERVLRISWLKEMETAFGKEVCKSSLLSIIDAARTSATDAGVAQNTGSALANALDQIRPTQFDAALAAAREIAECENALDALPNYGRGNRPAVDAGIALRVAAEKFLDAVDRNMEVFAADQNASSGDVPTNIASIEQSLSDIAQDLGSLQKREEATNAS